MGSQLTFQDAPTRTSRLASWPTKTLDDYGHVSVRHNNARRYPFIRRFVKSARSRVHHCLQLMAPRWVGGHADPVYLRDLYLDEDAFRRLSSPPPISFEATCREQQEKGPQGRTVRTHLRKPKISDRGNIFMFDKALLLICETSCRCVHKAR
jgi:hypothetical protein